MVRKLLAGSKKIRIARVGNHEKTKQRYQLDLAEITSGKEEKAVRKNIDLYRSLISTNNRKEDQKALQSWEDQLKILVSGEEEKRLQRLIQEGEKDQKEAEDSVRVLNGPRDEAIKYFQEYGSPPSINGSLIRPNSTWGGNKAYIYLCVGGDSEPNPTQSYPGPEQFSIFTNKDSYTVFAKDNLPGFILRHEAGHYEKQDPDKSENENLANRVAYERLIEAWKKYQQAGDISGYPFVFVSPRGVTITEKPTIKPTMRSV